MLSEHAEEILEALAVQMEEQGKKPLDLGIDRDNPAVDELAKLGYIRRDVDHIHLLDKGKAEAQKALRRHRLAERLLVDVLDIKDKGINEVSCKFEHLLHEGELRRMSVLSWAILRSARMENLFRREGAVGRKRIRRAG